MGRAPATQPQSMPRPVCHSPNFGVKTGLEHIQGVGPKKARAYLCVDMLMALSRTRRRTVLFSPRYARRTGAEETRTGKRMIAVWA
jgi:hypothetical protein